jgi:hypothetical protein
MVADSRACVNLVPHDTHTLYGKDATTGDFFRPDIAFLSEDLCFDRGDKERLSRIAGVTESYIEFKLKTDPFHGLSPKKNRPPSHDTNPALSPPDGKGNIYARGQLAEYARLLHNNGHSTFSFSAIVRPDVARLLLSNFICGLDRMTPEERGWDPSVVRLDKNCPEGHLAREIAEEVAKDTLPSCLTAADVIPDPMNSFRSLCLVTVLDEQKRESHRLVIDHPRTASLFPVGRGTRCFLAVDIGTREIVWLKDYWRPCVEDIPSESDVYSQLTDKNVPHVPEFAYGGGVPYSTSDLEAAVNKAINIEEIAFQFAGIWLYVHDGPKEAVLRPQSTRVGIANRLSEIEPLAHHRLMLKTIGRPLDTFTSVKELVMTLSHALEGM